LREGISDFRFEISKGTQRSLKGIFMNDLMNGNHGKDGNYEAATIVAMPDAGAPRVLPRRRWCAVQRLSPRVRLFINNAMRDGVTYKQILSDLAKKRVTCVSGKQLRDWYATGYADWLADQVYFERLALTLDSARPLKTPAAGKKNFRELSQLDLAAQMHAAARKFNLEKFCEHLNAKPESFFRLVFANALHERNAILREQMELNATKYRDVAKKEKRARKPKRGGVTLEELERIDRRMKL
jgi:hypothetical protein